MPVDYVPNAGSQLDRALRAYFIDEEATPQPTKSNGGIHLTLDTDERTNPLRTILSHDANEEVPFSGNQIFSVIITDQFDAIAQGSTDPELHRVAIDTQVGKMMLAMSQSDNETDSKLVAKNITDAGRALAVDESAGADPKKVIRAARNIDMAEFTCLFVEHVAHSRGHPKDEANNADTTTWHEQRRFRITVCPQAIVGYSNTEGQ